MADGSHRCESTDLDRTSGNVKNGFGKVLRKHRDSLPMFPQSSDSWMVCAAYALANISWRGLCNLPACGRVNSSLSLHHLLAIVR